jgi:hypothetical protein
MDLITDSLKKNQTQGTTSQESTVLIEKKSVEKQAVIWAIFFQIF